MCSASESQTSGSECFLNAASALLVLSLPSCAKSACLGGFFNGLSGHEWFNAKTCWTGFQEAREDCELLFCLVRVTVGMNEI